MADINIENMEENAELFMEKMGFAHDWFGPVIANSFSNKYLGVFLTKYYEAKHKKSKLTLMQSIFDVASTTLMRPTWRLIGKILKMRKGN